MCATVIHWWTHPRILLLYHKMAPTSSSASRSRRSTGMITEAAPEQRYEPLRHRPHTLPPSLSLMHARTHKPFSLSLTISLKHNIRFVLCVLPFTQTQHTHKYMHNNVIMTNNNNTYSQTNLLNPPERRCVRTDSRASQTNICRQTDARRFITDALIV